MIPHRRRLPCGATARRFPTAFLFLAVSLAASAPASAELIIDPTWDSSIANDPNASTIEATISQAIANYASLFADDITVNIKFQEMGGGLGQSNTWLGGVSYSSFLSHLAADKTTSADDTALASLPAGPNNPVDNSPNVTVSVANLKALGFTVGSTPDGFDGTISLNTSIMNLDRVTINPSKYDLLAVVSHEIDEVLGLGSALTKGFPARPEDLFRYDQNGNRSYTSSSGAQAYFSIDGGTTDLARFNQESTGDYGDWYSPFGHSPVQVQDAFGTPGTTPNLGFAELTALDVIGYNLAAQNPVVPEPASLALWGFGLALVGGIARRRAVRHK